MNHDLPTSLRTVFPSVVSWIITALLGFLAYQTWQNGQRLVGITTEMAVRVEKADKDHAGFATRVEVAGLAAALERVTAVVVALEVRLREQEIRAARGGR